jgi:hypothetical protein
MAGGLACSICLGFCTSLDESIAMTFRAKHCECLRVVFFRAQGAVDVKRNAFPSILVEVSELRELR